MGLLGGKSKSTTLQGYHALPPNAQKALDDITYGIRSMVSPVTHWTGEKNQENIDRFTPLAQTADETLAIERMRQGFSPTQDSLNSDISMLMNPYDTHVIDEINRQSQGDFSILKQAMDQAGQMGSNRTALSANDIDLTRLNQIGLFKQDQYNKALDTALGRLTDLRMQDSSNLMGIGDFTRNLDWQTKQAPINAINTAANLVSGTGLSSAYANTASSYSSSGGGGLGGIGGLLSGVGSIASGPIGGWLGGLGGTTGLSSGALALAGFSDRALKENIEPLGEENGHKIYRFNYKDHPEKYIGVMADEVEEFMPEAVFEVDGYKAVNYAKIGVRFRRG